MIENWAWISIREMADDLGVTRQRAHQIVKDHNLRTKKYSGFTLVNHEDYFYYLKLAGRRDLAAAAGRKSNTMIRTGKYDTTCQVCGSFAVKWEGRTACMVGHEYATGEP